MLRPLALAAAWPEAAGGKVGEEGKGLACHQGQSMQAGQGLGMLGCLGLDGQVEEDPLLRVDMQEVQPGMVDGRAEQQPALVGLLAPGKHLAVGAQHPQGQTLCRGLGPGLHQKLGARGQAQGEPVLVPGAEC